MTSIHATAVVDKESEMGSDVEIGPYCVIGQEVAIGDGTCLKSHVVLDGCTRIGKECTVFPFATIGTQTQDLKYKGGRTSVEIGDRTTLREYVTVNSATNEGEVTRVGNDCHIMAYGHVAHACRVGNGVIMANCATLAGEVVVQDQAIIGGLSAVHQFVRIGRLCFIGGCTRVTQDCPPFMMVVGNPAEVTGLNSIGLKRKEMAPEARSLLKEVYRALYREGLSTSQALEKIRAKPGICAEVEELLVFIENSGRGIIK